MGRLKGICISEKRGTEKHEVREAMVKMDWGIEGDAHGGKWHRQISLLSDEKIQEFRAKGAEVAYGAFGENTLLPKLAMIFLIPLCPPALPFLRILSCPTSRLISS